MSVGSADATSIGAPVAAAALAAAAAAWSSEASAASEDVFGAADDALEAEFCVDGFASLFLAILSDPFSSAS